MTGQTRDTEPGTLGTLALFCYSATLAAMLSIGYALIALALKTAELQQLVERARGGY